MTTPDQNTGKQYGRFLPDRPVGLQDDLLWRETIISQEITDIAESLVNPLRYPESPVLSSSITFAIHGRWGMGKSSALRMIREKAIEIATKAGVDQHLKFCEYAAPIYEMPPHEARTTMALRMLSALAGGDPRKAIDRFLRDDSADDILPRGNGINQPGGTSYALEKVALNLSRLIGFDQIVADELKKQDGHNYALVVLIDDLDRCQTDFIWQVLESIQQLSDISNLFFILAVEQERLRKTVEERFERTGGAVSADFALEKYIQHSVSVPDMDVNSLNTFVERLMHDYIEKDVFSSTIVDNIPFLQYGLRVLTPRSVKRCLNTIHSTLNRRLQQEATSEGRQLAVKERLLEYSWPDFHHQYLLPANSSRSQRLPQSRQQLNFLLLETACRTFSFNSDTEELYFNLKRLSERYKLNWETLDPELVRYLGHPPYWFLQPESRQSEENNSFFAIMQGQFPMSQTKNFDDEALADIANLPEDVEGDFMSYYLQSEAAEASNQRYECLQNAQLLLTLVQQNRTAFGTRHAPIVGNVAINAEKFEETNLAIKLYDLALVLDPAHENNMINYVDFIVKVPVPDRYDKAEELLKYLKTARYRIERVLAMEARLRHLRHQDSEEVSEEVVHQIIAEFHADPSNRRKFTGVISFLNAINNYKDMRIVSREHYEAVTSDQNRYAAARGLADMLAATPDEHNELEAMEMYSSLLKRFEGRGEDFNIPELKHNYATLLYKYDYNAEAGQLWFEAYRDKGNSKNIQRAYSLYLMHTRRPDLGALVAQGQPLTELALQPSEKPFPEHFLDEDIDRWWER